MSEKISVRIGGDAQEAVETYAEDKEVNAGEAAEKLIMIGWNRRRALSKWAKAQSKKEPSEAKPKKEKKIKAEKPAKKTKAKSDKPKKTKDQAGKARAKKATQVAEVTEVVSEMLELASGLAPDQASEEVA